MKHSNADRLNETFVPTAIRWPALFGLLGIACFFGGFGIWALTAPLAGAAAAPGSLVASGQNKVVQHLEGGIISEILVSEGEQIQAGDPVFILDRTAAESSLDRLTAQRDYLMAREARLRTERNGDVDIVFPDALVQRIDDVMIAGMIEDQRVEFTNRLERHLVELRILGKKIQAFEEEIIGIEAQNVALDQQIDLLGKELASLDDLLGQGLITQERVLALQRTMAALRGERGQNIARIATVRQEIAQLEEESGRMTGARQEEASITLNKTRAELQDTESQIRAASDVLDRVVVRAPIAGTVVKLNIHTVGEVVRSGQSLLEMLPIHAELLIEARIRPEDIDSVKVGHFATVMFSALDRSTTPVVEAQVDYVSADRLIDDVTQQIYYLARLRLTDLARTKVDASDLYPGMQLETYILTNERTFAEYLVRPLLDSFRKAFREN